MTKILLVEDHEEVCDFVTSYLSERGFEVLVSSDGQDAIDKVAIDRPQLVLLDMNLPVKDGWSVARELRSAGNKVAIIALTAHAMSGDREKSLEAGCDDFHAKPLDIGQLVTQIDEVLLRQEEGKSSYDRH